LTQADVNAAYLAHIVADEPGGPRGDPVQSPLLARDPSNLMLMCDCHHRLIDREDLAGHPVDLLREMKAEHETRIALQTALGPECQSEVICYQANIGPQPTPLHFRECARALHPQRYPASPRGIGLSLGDCALRDRDASFWQLEAAHLVEQFGERVGPRIARLPHVSVFALAPQPLLILLGRMLSDLPVVQVFQRRREPQTWEWPDHADDQTIVVREPTEGKVPALALGLTNAIQPERIRRVLPNAAIWTVTVPRPHHDCIQSTAQLEALRTAMRSVFDRIRDAHPDAELLHVFPVAPVSALVELGRVIQPKRHLPLLVYDERELFRPVLKIPADFRDVSRRMSEVSC